MNAVVPLNKTAKAGADGLLVRAFVIDDETRVAVTAATAVRYPEARIYDGGISTAMSNLSQDATPTHVIIDVSDSDEPAAALRLLLTVCSPGIHIIAVGTVNDVPYYRALMDAGADDYLLRPFEPEALRQCLERLTDDKSGVESKPKSLNTVGFVGARGGVGASTLAVNIAWHAANDLGHRCALLDLDVQFGTVTLALDLEPCSGMREILEDPERVDSLFISSSMVRESKNLLVLGSEEPLGNDLTIDPGALGMLLEALESEAEYVFIDLPRALVVSHPNLLSKLDSMVLVADPSLASVRDTTRLAEFIREHAPDTQLIVVANKVGANKKGELPLAEFKRSIHLPVDHWIPWDAKIPAEAASAGKSLAAIGAGAPIVSAINKLGEQIAPNASNEPPARGLAKWLHRN